MVEWANGSGPRCRSASQELQRLPCMPMLPAIWQRSRDSNPSSSWLRTTRAHPGRTAKLVLRARIRTRDLPLTRRLHLPLCYRSIGVNDGDRTRTFSFTERRADHYTTNTINWRCAKELNLVMRVCSPPPNPSDSRIIWHGRKELNPSRGGFGDRAADRSSPANWLPAQDSNLERRD